jgi:hypothetical protein
MAINLERVYRMIGRDIKELLLSIDVSNVNEGKLMAIKERVRRQILYLNAATVKWADSEIPKSYRLGARRARVALEILGRKPRRPAIDAPELKVKDDTLDKVIMANNSIQTTVDKYLGITFLASKTLRSAQVQEQQFDAEDARTTYEKYGQQAVLQQKSRGWLAARIREHLQGLIGEESFIEINGRFYQMKKYAQLVARTSLRDAQTKATLELCKQYQNDLVQVSDHATDCEICQEYEGEIYSISGSHPKYPPLSESPPYHPNCKHSLLPTSEEAIRAREIFG